MSELRAHFPERDAYLDRLAQHYADGLLDDAGFEARRDLLLQATTHGEMLRAFDGLPKPRYRDGGTTQRRSGIGRRALLIGGIAAAGVVAVGAGVSIFGARSYTAPYYPEATSAAEEIVWTGEPVFLDYGALDESMMTLRERGLTLVSELTWDVDGVRGVAMSPRAPGELRTFTRDNARPLIVSEGVEGEVPRSVELDPLQDMVFQAMDRAPMDFGVDATTSRVQLIFTDLGNPAVEALVEDFNNVVIGTARYDMDGNLTNLEEHQ